MQPLTVLDPQVRLQIGVDTINLLMAKKPALQIAQIQKAKAKTPAPPVAKSKGSAFRCISTVSFKSPQAKCQDNSTHQSYYFQGG